VAHTHQGVPSSQSLAVADHLRMLYGADGGDAPGYLVVFTLPDRQTYSFAGDDLFGETCDRIAALAERSDVYIGMGLQQAPPTPGERGSAETVLAIPGMWFDLDVVGPTHKQTALPATQQAALGFLASLALEPSLVIDSGGGLQAHWLFHDLQVLADEHDRTIADRLSRRVQDAIITRGAEHGWKFDNTADLARILRPAGTLNWKSGTPLPVRTICSSTARYAPRDLVQLCRPLPKVRTQPPPNSGKVSRANTDDDTRIRAYLDKVGPQPEGYRDNAAIRAALWLVNDFALPDDVALDYLRRWNAGNLPPLPDPVIQRKIKQARRSARRPFGCAKAAS
jgi:hypothetical protein